MKVSWKNLRDVNICRRRLHVVSYPWISNRSADERRHSNVEDVGKHNGYRWRDVVPQPRGRKCKEKGSGYHEKETGDDVDRPMSSVLQSTSPTEHSIASEIFVVAAKFRILRKVRRLMD